MQQIIKKLEALHRINDKAEKFTEITDENFIEHGVLFFIPLEKFEVKILIPAPHHKTIFQNGTPTYKQGIIPKVWGVKIFKHTISSLCTGRMLCP